MIVNPEMPAGETNQLLGSKQVELYQRIQAFSLDQPDDQLPFSRRVARDNGWSLEYAQRVIEEYKKFVFLAVAAGHPVTPSDQVDQVWHLHLSYTRSYWEEFCPKILQMPLHHDPTSGGQAENLKFDDWYGKTLESYERFFGQVPPTDIWSSPEVRFGRDLSFMRVNTQQNWVLPKLQIQKGATVGSIIVLAIALGGCYIKTSESSANPLAGFLLAVICIGAGCGLIGFLAGIVNFLKNPKAPHIGGCSGGGCGGCGGGGCGGG